MLNTMNWHMPMRIRATLIAGALLLLLLSSQNVATQSVAVTDGLDEFWSEVSRCIAAGDFAGLVATYHEDAVLVSEQTSSSQTISDALERWKPGILATRSGKATSMVEFRLSRRINDPLTAHETGIFHYATTAASGESEEAYIHFEALLIKKESGWKMLMEYQKQAATESEWAAIN